MKKLFLFFILFAANIYVSGQCTPDSSITHNDPGIYPDTIVNLPHATIGLAYVASIQINVITDTVYLGFTVPVDSVVIDNVIGYVPAMNGVGAGPNKDIHPFEPPGKPHVPGVQE